MCRKLVLAKRVLQVTHTHGIVKKNSKAIVCSVKKKLIHHVVTSTALSLELTHTCVHSAFQAPYWTDFKKRKIVGHFVAAAILTVPHYTVIVIKGLLKISTWSAIPKRRKYPPTASQLIFLAATAILNINKSFCFHISLSS